MDGMRWWLNERTNEWVRMNGCLSIWKGRITKSSYRNLSRGESRGMKLRGAILENGRMKSIEMHVIYRSEMK